MTSTREPITVGTKLWIKNGSDRFCAHRPHRGWLFGTVLSIDLETGRYTVALPRRRPWRGARVLVEET